MSTKWPKGSAGEKEQKEARIVGVILCIVTLLLLAVQFVIPSEYRDAVKFTSTWLNIIGGGLVALSVVPFIKAFSAGEEGSYAYARWWTAMIAAGFLLAAVEAL